MVEDELKSNERDREEMCCRCPFKVFISVSKTGIVSGQKYSMLSGDVLQHKSSITVS